MMQYLFVFSCKDSSLQKLNWTAPRQRSANAHIFVKLNYMVYM